MKSLSILVADDEENIRVLIEHWLASVGHSATGVGSADEAFAAITQRNFDLLITDILMPGGDGLDLIARIKKAQPAVRILAISGGGHYLQGTDCLRMARGLGAHAVVMKPFTWQQLQAGITQALAPIVESQWGSGQ